MFKYSKKILILLIGLLCLVQNLGALEPDLRDLGFSDSETQANPRLQRNLEDRRFYLHQHQIWGLVSVSAMAATLISGGEGSLPAEHPFLAGVSIASYSAAAYTAWAAPELPLGLPYGGSLWHRRLLWIHFPGMILTPILGYLAAKKVQKSEDLNGIEKYHKDVAGITAAILGVSALSVTVEF